MNIKNPSQFLRVTLKDHLRMQFFERSNLLSNRDCKYIDSATRRENRIRSDVTSFNLKATRLTRGIVRVGVRFPARKSWRNPEVSRSSYLRGREWKKLDGACAQSLFCAKYLRRASLYYLQRKRRKK